MVTPLSGGGGVARALAPFAAMFDSGLLVVTNFLGASVALLTECFCFDGSTAAPLGRASGLAWTGLATGLAETDFDGFTVFAGFAGAAFLTTAFLTAFAAGLRDGAAALLGFFAGLAVGFAFAAGFFAPVFEGGLRAALAATRATFLPLAGAFAVFARTIGFALLFAIPKPIL